MKKITEKTGSWWAWLFQAKNQSNRASGNSNCIRDLVSNQNELIDKISRLEKELDKIKKA